MNKSTPNINKKIKKSKNKIIKKKESSKTFKNNKANTMGLHFQINNYNINNINKVNSKKIKPIRKKKSKTDKRAKKQKAIRTKDLMDNTKTQIITKKENIIKFTEYNDLELNSLKYPEALRVDKRTYIQFYFSLLRTNHLLIFSFCPNKDYNSRIIKFFLFFFFSQFISLLMPYFLLIRLYKKFIKTKANLISFTKFLKSFILQ